MKLTTQNSIEATLVLAFGAACIPLIFWIPKWVQKQERNTAQSIELDATTNGFTLRTSFKPCEARVTNGQWTIHFKR